MKKIIIILLILLSTGCTSYTELNDLSIVNTLGIDYSKEYNVYLSYKNSNNKSNILTASNKTLKEAINTFYLSSNKQLYMSHINLLILTDNAIDNKLNEILDTFLSDNNYRNNFYVVIMNSIDLKNFFDDKLDSDDITGLININEKETSTTRKIELEELIKELSINKNHYLPQISYKNKKLSLEGYTLIKNNKTYKSLTIDDSIILNILTNNFNKAFIRNINIYSGNTNIKVSNNKVIFNIKITTNTSDIDNLKKELYSFINKYKEDYDILKIDNLINNNKYNYKTIKYEIKILNTIKKDFIKDDKYE